MKKITALLVAGLMLASCIGSTDEQPTYVSKPLVRTQLVLSPEPDLRVPSPTEWIIIAGLDDAREYFAENPDGVLYAVNRISRDNISQNEKIMQTRILHLLSQIDAYEAYYLTSEEWMNQLQAEEIFVMCNPDLNANPDGCQ